MNKRWKVGVALLSLAIVAAAIIFGVGFGTKRKSGDNGQTPVIFTVSFETNGGVEVPSVSGEAGAALVLPVPYRDGYEFDGWYTDGGFTQAAPSFVPARNTTYYAKYAKLYTVRFVIDGDSVNFTGRAGTEVAVPTPEREGAVFEGWYADPDCLKPVLPATVIAGDSAYYAKFSPLYTVRFET
ncbi:MAG: InlB B-repeat-containing protein, partial [Clostridia bacterium]|nr:InlB B-repeat-containing protein [Clostridia bacterium]